MSTRKDKKKSNNFTGEEQELLTQLVKKYENIVENKKSGQTTWDKKKYIWTEIEREFNSQSKNGVFRDAKSLTTKFRNMKKECKQKFSAQKKSLMQTGGGPPVQIDITNIDLEVRDIIGRTPVEGLPALHDDDCENNEICQHNQPELVQLETLELEEDSTNIIQQAINSKLIAVAQDIPGTSNKSHTSMADSQENWSQYSPAMLKKPVDNKLKAQNSARPRERTRTLSNTKSQLYEELMQAKLNFIELQEKKFLEEWAIKKRILDIELELKEKELINSKK